MPMRSVPTRSARAATSSTSRPERGSGCGARSAPSCCCPSRPWRHRCNGPMPRPRSPPCAPCRVRLRMRASPPAWLLRACPDAWSASSAMASRWWSTWPTTRKRRANWRPGPGHGRPQAPPPWCCRRLPTRTWPRSSRRWKAAWTAGTWPGSRASRAARRSMSSPRAWPVPRLRTAAGMRALKRRCPGRSRNPRRAIGWSWPGPSTPPPPRWRCCVQGNDGPGPGPPPIIADTSRQAPVPVDTTLKQRLIGAAVLVALAVIFLPMLVQGPAPDSGVADVSTRVPDAPAGGYETRELPLLGPAADTPVPAPETAGVAEEDAAPATPAADPATAAGRWAVSFGAYASERDAEAVISRLRQAGLDGFSEEDTVNGRQAWRVRVGPYADRALAEAGRLRAVRIRNDVNAQVIALDAADGEGTQGAAATAATQATAPAPAQATAASAPLPAREAPRTVSTTTTTAPATSSPAAAS